MTSSKGLDRNTVIGEFEDVHGQIAEVHADSPSGGKRPIDIPGKRTDVHRTEVIAWYRNTLATSPTLGVHMERGQESETG
ncbi:hypothetical protein HD596_003766 [Nonomuraea jabiensis]|uniref:Uncharacterized protein n=1 Tax=Nonomuraea jabiensis TaxID=882448 RepID=A0A7W9LAT4_9ACTN|nr:hypothetical protein [Nonomuraea jabiensis]